MKKTYLCVKQHKKTGLKYFCKTTQSNPIRYPGSGVKWREHLLEHGWEFDTIECWEFDNIDECSKFAINFSIENNIVESEMWANLKIENGRDGGTVKGHKKPPRTAEHAKKIGDAQRGIPKPSISISNRNRIVSEDSNIKRSLALKGVKKPTRTAEHKHNMSLAKKGKSLQIIKCPHCDKIGGGGAMKQWHFDKCKKKNDK